MVQRLQLMYGMKIILISCGSFYISIGTDAIVLQVIFNLLRFFSHTKNTKVYFILLIRWKYKKTATYYRTLFDYLKRVLFLRI